MGTKFNCHELFTGRCPLAEKVLPYVIAIEAKQHRQGDEEFAADFTTPCPVSGIDEYDTTMSLIATLAILLLSSPQTLDASWLQNPQLHHALKATDPYRIDPRFSHRIWSQRHALLRNAITSAISPGFLANPLVPPPGALNGCITADGYTIAHLCDSANIPVLKDLFYILTDTTTSEDAVSPAQKDYAITNPALKNGEELIWTPYCYSKGRSANICDGGINYSHRCGILPKIATPHRNDEDENHMF